VGKVLRKERRWSWAAKVRTLIDKISDGVLDLKFVEVSWGEGSALAMFAEYFAAEVTGFEIREYSRSLGWDPILVRRALGVPRVAWGVAEVAEDEVLDHLQCLDARFGPISGVVEEEVGCLLHGPWFYG
jgi:hypothetical protein